MCLPLPDAEVSHVKGENSMHPNHLQPEQEQSYTEAYFYLADCGTTINVRRMMNKDNENYHHHHQKKKSLPIHLCMIEVSLMKVSRIMAFLMLVFFSPGG